MDRPPPVEGLFCWPVLIMVCRLMGVWGGEQIDFDGKTMKGWILLDHLLHLLPLRLRMREGLFLFFWLCWGSLHGLND